jgi:hypothetical protein
MILALFDELLFIVGFLKKISFEHVDSWPKIVLLRTHLGNSTTELILN